MTLLILILALILVLPFLVNVIKRGVGPRWIDYDAWRLANGYSPALVAKVCRARNIHLKIRYLDGSNRIRRSEAASLARNIYRYRVEDARKDRNDLLRNVKAAMIALVAEKVVGDVHRPDGVPAKKAIAKMRQEVERKYDRFVMVRLSEVSDILTEVGIDIGKATSMLEDDNMLLYHQSPLGEETPIDSVERRACSLALGAAIESKPLSKIDALRALDSIDVLVAHQQELRLGVQSTGAPPPRP
jgi:hypothetical protein